MGTFLRDIKYGARMLLKNPGFTLVAVLALSLGIGANSAIFSVVNAVLLRPLPFDSPERLVTLMIKDEGDGSVSKEFSYPNLVDLRDQNQVFEQVAGYSNSAAFLTGGDEPERLRGAIVTADLFPLLGVKPMLGRTFTREEDQPGSAAVIVLSHELWKRRFNSDQKIIGQQIKIQSGPATVLGVMPEGFQFPIQTNRAEFWMPLASSVARTSLESRGGVWINALARLKPGATLQQAQAESNIVARRLSAQYPETNTDTGFALKSMHENLVGDVRPALLILLGAVGFVLLIACANVANLLLARAATRQKEIAIRTALGASRLRVIRQLLTESLLLSLMGGGLGLLLAVWGVDLLVAASPADIPRLSEIGLDARVVIFTLAVALFTGFIFGLAPALQASKSDLNEALKEGGGRGSSEGARRNRVRSLLVVTEVALSLVLLIGAGLLIQSFWRLLNVHPGFNPDNLLTADVVLRTTADQRAQRFQETLERVAALPGVASVAAVYPLPLGGSAEAYTFQVEGRAPAAPGNVPVSDYRIVNPDYFRTMGIAVQKGRAFTERDGTDAPAVVIINETFARRYFPDEDAIGKRIIASDGSNAPPREIVGIVSDVRHAGLDAEAGAEYYVSYLQSPPPARMTVVARTASADPSSISTSLRGAIRQVDQNTPVYNVRTMNHLLAESVGRRRFNMMLLGAFALVALVLASIGIYGVMSYSVTQRTHEIGIRVALGAQSSDVLRMIVGQGMILALIGTGLGLVAAFLLTRVMSSLLFGVSSTDPATYIVISLLLILMAFLACYIPARRATRVDPMVALRYE